MEFESFIYLLFSIYKMQGVFPGAERDINKMELYIHVLSIV